MFFIAMVPMFQFHKVRLKGDYMLPTTLVSLFQFHKVRLKAKCPNHRLHGSLGFNSIRYD